MMYFFLATIKNWMGGCFVSVFATVIAILPKT